MTPTISPTRIGDTNVRRDLVLIATPRLSRLGFTTPENRSLVVKSTVGEVSFREPETSGDNEGIKSLKLKLLSVVSGLNRGLVASVDDLQRAETAAKQLKSAGGPVDLTEVVAVLVYPPDACFVSLLASASVCHLLVAFVHGLVFQRIDVFSKDFDNIAEVEIGAPWPLPPLEATATLAHKFELLGTCKIKITFEKTTVKTSGNLAQIPPFDIPRLPDSFRPPSGNLATYDQVGDDQEGNPLGFLCEIQAKAKKEMGLKILVLVEGKLEKVILLPSVSVLLDALEKSISTSRITYDISACLVFRRDSTTPAIFDDSNDFPDENRRSWRIIATPRSSRLCFTTPEKRSLVVKSTVGEVSFCEPETSGDNKGIESLKLKLLASEADSIKIWRISFVIMMLCGLQSVVSELNRGLVASVDDLQRAETAAKQLKSAGGPVDLTEGLD
ncbi:hypothetical protein Bca4012_025909 [Brassica carinata]